VEFDRFSKSWFCLAGSVVGCLVGWQSSGMASRRLYGGYQVDIRWLLGGDQLTIRWLSSADYQKDIRWLLGG
jgi:hypothetical protein